MGMGISLGWVLTLLMSHFQHLFATVAHYSVYIGREEERDVVRGWEGNFFILTISSPEIIQ